MKMNIIIYLLIAIKQIWSINFLELGFTGKEYDGNYIWCLAMNLAWTEMNKNILHEPAQLSLNAKTSMAYLNAFNNPVVTTSDIDEDSYYIKSGFG